VGFCRFGARSLARPPMAALMTGRLAPQMVFATPNMAAVAERASVESAPGAIWRYSNGKGVDHHGAVRALAFKWIRIVFRCWKERVAYDASTYLATLTRRGSPLVAVPAIAKAV